VQYYRLVLKSYWSFSPTSEAFDRGLCLLGGFMSIGTEILSLRQDKFSSVAALIGALDRLSASNEHLEMRVYPVTECADLVLLNVAVHAMEALSELPIQASRRAAQPSRRRRPRHIPGHPQGQITMFATT